MKKRTLSLLSLALFMNVFAQSSDEKVKTLLDKMTLEEKVGQMTQVTFDVIAKPEAENDGFPVDMKKLETAIVQYHVGSILNTPYNKAQSLETWNKIITAVQDVSKKTRLQIPVIYGIDAIHGTTYTRGGTLFPQAINIGASFNPELSKIAGAITAREMKASGMTWNFYPVLDIGRQPLWSRFWETYGEDVHVAATHGVAYIHGHQGDDYSKAEFAPTCMKHYTGYGYPLNGKDRTPAWIGEKTLREIYLPSFEAAVKAGSPTVMINSGEIDGVPGHANYHLLTEILRGELQFKGIAVSDWEDIVRLYSRDKVADSPEQAVKMAVMAGVDMSMVPYNFSFFDILVKLVKNGEVPMSRIDEAVSRILKVKIESGLLADPYPKKELIKLFANEDATAQNLAAARETIVLAKNANNLLPLSKSANILVTGPTANLLQVLNGGWTVTWQGDEENLYPQEKLTVLEALKATSKGKVTYVEGTTFTNPVNIEEAVKQAASNDVIVLCLGEKAYCETPGNIENLILDEAQLDLAEAMLKTGKPVVLILLEGRPRVVTQIAEKSSAVVVAMRPGMEGAIALTDILFGDYNPDAKLPFSYPRNPNGFSTYDYKPLEVYDGMVINPLYTFGHGLSYTTFETSGLKLSKKEIKAGEGLEVKVTVKNTGKIAGKEAVLIYLNDNAAQVSRPVKQLKSFQKVFLKPGESKELTFNLTDADFSYIGLQNKRIIEPGKFTVFTGSMTDSFTLLP